MNVERPALFVEKNKSRFKGADQGYINVKGKFDQFDLALKEKDAHSKEVGYIESK